MVSPLVWHDRWLLGIERLDIEHRELVDCFNRLAEVSRNSAEAAVTGGPVGNDGGLAEARLTRLQALIEALRRHFRAEEAFLDGIDYPGYSEHKSEHALHLAELTHLYRRLETARNEGRAGHIEATQLESMKTRLLDHLAEDRRVARHYFAQLGVGVPEENRRTRRAAPRWPRP